MVRIDAPWNVAPMANDLTIGNRPPVRQFPRHAMCPDPTLALCAVAREGNLAVSSERRRCPDPAAVGVAPYLRPEAILRADGGTTNFPDRQVYATYIIGLFRKSGRNDWRKFGVRSRNPRLRQHYATPARNSIATPVRAMMSFMVAGRGWRLPRSKLK